MTGSQVVNAEEDRHKLVVEYKDALQPADFYQNFKQRGLRSVQIIPHIEFDDRGELTASSVTAELWGQFLIALFEHWVRADIGRISVELFDATLQKWCGSENVQLRRECQECDWHRLCRHSQEDSPGNVLCVGYQAFYSHSAPHMRVMRDLIKQHRSPMELMTMLR
ncbi:radical SAM protein [Escherichia sp. E10V10]|uniref:radical SAM protein n=1 Tax=unclassified Escherichia TaxID=2608889 RepID=UPI001029F9C0|nr:MULTISPECIES: radical SAM protein [unclassified Escherichia]RZM97801.1 radical SAM protein [Escherichia sp. E14V5]RZN01263.1 radical SAM protein [Escherichia sp. E14V7]RZN26203.1 radical SAM protein [Escherichia sp. E14V10]RZN48875.1 radical SAM protein [Escherichia sp. E13S3]RZN52286.1 radical SAM protein [Escherichia sp. E10V10]